MSRLKPAVPRPSLRTQVVVCLAQQGSATAAEVAAALGKSRGDVYAELQRMKGDSLVSTGQYREGGARWWKLRQQ